MSDQKKISFGFSKIKKPTQLLAQTSKKESDIELIQCLEEKTIKILGKKIEEEKPFVIPLIGNTKTSAALAALKALKNTIEGIEEEEPTDKDTNPELDATAPKTLEQKAAQEILNSLKENQDLTDDGKKILSLPLTSDELPLDGAKESTIDDYESIPIAQFGLAMLRGMGWKDEPKDKKKNNLKPDGPEVRPKGMGLGADKMVKPKPLLVAPARDEVLEIKKGSPIRVLLGKHKDLYGMIESLDDHAGRILVKLALGGTREWFNEFMIQPVSKAEYTQYGKVINSAKYEEYKIKQEKEEQLKKEAYIKKEKVESTSSTNNRYRSNSQQSSDNSYDGGGPSSSQTKHRSQSADRVKKSEYERNRDKSANNKEFPNTSRKQYSDSSSEEDISHRKKPSYHHHKSSNYKKTKSKRHNRSRSRSREHRRHRNDSSNSSDDNEKHHKKKTKKSKRPRSRSRDRRSSVV